METMLNVKIDYRKAFRQAHRELKQSNKRLKAVVYRELNRGANRFAKRVTKHVIKNTNVKGDKGSRISQNEFIAKYIKIRENTSNKICLLYTSDAADE